MERRLDVVGARCGGAWRLSDADCSSISSSVAFCGASRMLFGASASGYVYCWR
jgi:hypothetical protein